MSKRELFIRSGTGVVIVAITLLAIVFSPYSFLVLLGLIGFIGTREYFKLDFVSPGPWLINLVSFIFSLIIMASGYFLIKQQNPVVMIIMLPVIISFIVLLQLMAFNSPEEIVKKGKSIYSAASYIVLPLMCGTIFLMHSYSYRYVLIPVILIWVNDVGAYLFGSRLGTTKIKPSISPGKSLQGTIGGGFVTLLTAFILWRLWPDIQVYYLTTLAVLIPIVSISGDLWESALKRNAGVKDSGNILPGHGGILDRYDSLLFVLPFAALAYYIFVI